MTIVMKPSVYLICLGTISAISAFGQTTHVVPNNPQYDVSAPPGSSTSIKYSVLRFDSQGYIIPYTYSNCQFNWTFVSGHQFGTGNSTLTIVGDNQVDVGWDNVGTGKISVKVSNAPNKTCSIGYSTDTYSFTQKIRYIGPLDQVRLNNNPASVSNLTCGSNAVTFSVPPPSTLNPTNASINYNWALPSGWSLVSGQGTNTIQATPNASGSGVVKVTGIRNDEGYIPVTSQMTVNRLKPTAPTTVTGIGTLCPSQTVSVSASGAANATGYEWTSANGVLVNGTTNTGLIGANASVSGTGPSYYNGLGSYSVRAYSSICQTYSSLVTKNIQTYGTAPVSYPTLTLFDANSNMWQFSHAYVSGATWTYYLAAGSATLQQNIGDCYITTTNGASVCVYGSNSCGQGATYCFNVPAQGGMMRVAPNPVKDKLSMQFDNTSRSEDLPAHVDLYQESSTSAVRSVDVQDVYKRQAFTDKNRIELPVGDLPRGTYYLHAVPNEQSKQNIQRIRVILQ